MDSLSVIQGLWIGKKLSVMEQLSISSFIKNGHEYHLYIYEDVEGIPKGTVIKNANEIIPKNNIFLSEGADGSPSYASFSELFRYKLLFDKGGFWCDTDIICLKPFDFKSDYVFGWEKGKKSDLINCAVTKVPVGSELIKFCYDTSKLKNPSVLSFEETGPKLLTLAVGKFKLSSFCLPVHIFYPINWWDWKDIISSKFSKRVKINIRLRNSYAVHLWHELWRIGHKNKDSVYSQLCLYEKLKDRYLNETI